MNSICVECCQIIREGSICYTCSTFTPEQLEQATEPIKDDSNVKPLEPSTLCVDDLDNDGNPIKVGQIRQLKLGMADTGSAPFQIIGASFVRTNKRVIQGMFGALEDVTIDWLKTTHIQQFKKLGN